MATFEIDPDIRRAATLPSEFYTDEGHLQRSIEKIFAPSWQFAGRAADVEGLVPFTLLPGSLDEPLLLSRAGGEVRCLSNVCTHRGKILVEHPCEANLIRCGYHGRRFSLDGKFLSMPEFEGVENFPSADDDLRAVSLAEALGFLFVSLEPALDLKQALSDVPDITMGFDLAELRLTGTRDYTVNAHWALYCENYLEGFHIPYVHRSLNEVVDYGSYTTDLYRYSSLQTGYDDAGGVAARYLFVFPNTMLNFYPWGVSVNVVKPVTPSCTVVSFLTYVADESLMDKGAGADLHGVEMEDEAVVESVQRGIRSRFYSHGRYSPTREQGTHHFHRLIAETMVEA
jgi:choline monooxygenase